ncbi:helix-turn-helix transcriptional regulator [Candidatus Soleaferrea massiliensis]|uniref:helix-turn-helix transcriptional regulator n=1 Tax=Candidatus Soleaferrea massiliensis TaxID=1470354 RepID=UPI000591184E|nr:helix-turn-helix transcriptional regulator [Candidatus Soleaferrea massiliensis]
MRRKDNRQFVQLGLNIAYYRKMKGLTQEQFAETLGISRTHLSSIESPKSSHAPSLELVLKISRALEINIDKLLDLNL